MLHKVLKFANYAGSARLKKSCFFALIMPKIMLAKYTKAYTSDTFTVVNDPFTAANWRGTCVRTFPG